jgi:hypothetical protein
MHTVGFSSDEQRKEAFQKWAEFRDRKPAAEEGGKEAEKKEAAEKG